MHVIHRSFSGSVGGSRGTTGRDRHRRAHPVRLAVAPNLTGP
ncbi:hypothetical protein G443_001968 [Actinoalloteichus cyanogriseus DSM 43889]|uniref:Uncharacterized protein n=1 Tax=Actinoalloteichus caeruleus DSM 43889 TaxID=1120930 RepID=A0ABT1JH12_ACTCY|nr:hypothetical protein [Actinoalloteichus caeruleus DSM 43889]